MKGRGRSVGVTDVTSETNWTDWMEFVSVNFVWVVRDEMGKEVD